MDYAVLISMAIAMCTLIVILVYSISITWTIFEKGKETKLAAEKYAKDIKTRTDNQYNKYAALPPKELDDRLCAIFSQTLELTSITDVSEKDPSGATILYAKATEEVIKYLGHETIEALDYYYGKNFVIKWCELRFRILENRGVISKVLNKSIYADTVNKELITEG